MEYKLPSREDYKRVSEEYREDLLRLLDIEDASEEARLRILDTKSIPEEARLRATLVVPSVVWNFKEGFLERLFVQEDWNDDVYYINENWSFGKSKKYIKTVKEKVEDCESKQTVILFSPSDFRRLVRYPTSRLHINIERLLIYRTHARLDGSLSDESGSMKSFTYNWLIKENKNNSLL